MSASATLEPADSGEIDAKDVEADENALDELDPAESGGIDLKDVEFDETDSQGSQEFEDIAIRFTSMEEGKLFSEAIELCRAGLRRADRILILIQDGNSLNIKDSYGSKAAFVTLKREISSAIIRRVRRKNRAIYINDAMVDEELSPRQSIRRIGQRSVLCTPINSRGQYIGILYADSVSVIGAFGDTELRWSIRLATALGKRLGQLEPREKKKSFTGPATAKEFESAPIGAKAAPLPRPKPEEKVVFLRSLACMLGSGFPIHGALDLLAEGQDRMAPYAVSMAEAVSKGLPLSRAFARHPDLFGKDVINLLIVGENSGTLDEVTSTIADAEEKQMVMRGKVISALTYPAVVFGFCALSCLLAPPLFLNDFFANLDQTSNVALPWLTRMVMAVSAALWNPALWIGLITIALLTRYIIREASTSAYLVRQAESLLLGAPVLGETYRNIVVLRFARALGLQLGAGMYLNRSVLLAGESSGSPLLLEEAGVVVQRVKAGESFSFALDRSQFFPKTLVEFIRVGEETAKLPEMCGFIESLLTARAEASIETAQAMIEPLAMSIVGFLVGIVAMACLLPLVQMVQAFV